MGSTMFLHLRDGTFSRTERALLLLEVLLAIGAYGGGVALILGAVDLGDAAQHLPFASLSFAGAALLVVNGVLPTVVVIGAIRCRGWARHGHLAVGLALVSWIVVQVGFLGWPPHWLQIVYFIYGVVIVTLASQHLRSKADDNAGTVNSVQR